ncbi:MAG: hypothetical protein GTN62_00110 [Gemmatimonadales bacterium]|nr:hypothetical protein [Gemmatimonadales bacterium]NIN48511.1 hypothetical protein [Gemmatimonadales bacterium]NIP05975.1 hypothetical protein [Gemmatimonadales bacterium]NIQ99927.1 hypothetical protein [Gemmatimonadales bacterium]NIS64386.1 hypothetical protein [Gemmatimonadales bacterium]
MERNNGFDDETQRYLDGEQAEPLETEGKADADRFREAMANYVDGLEPPGPEVDRAVMAVVSRRPIRLHHRRWKRRYAIGGLIAATVIGALVVLPGGGEAPPTDLPSRLRGDAGEGVLQIPVVRPRDGSVLVRGEAVFEWRQVGTDVLYRVALADEDGDRVWSGSTTSSMLALPSAVELLPGQSYFWYVDALLPDGLSATTGVRRFEIGH